MFTMIPISLPLVSPTPKAISITCLISMRSIYNVRHSSLLPPFIGKSHHHISEPPSNQQNRIEKSALIQSKDRIHRSFNQDKHKSPANTDSVSEKANINPAPIFKLILDSMFPKAICIQCYLPLNYISKKHDNLEVFSLYSEMNISDMIHPKCIDGYRKIIYYIFHVLF